jgi:hypothetical protein
MDLQFRLQVTKGDTMTTGKNMRTLTKICACAALIGMMGSGAGAAAEPSHVMWGCHAGYFFTPEKLYQASLDMLFAALEANPDYKVVMELEPYTIERMKKGEMFAFEKFGRDASKSGLRDDARLETLRRFVKNGRIEMVCAAYTQPILHTMGEESVIRQFTYGIRSIEDCLGTPVKFYGYQENGACSQIPQILNAAGLAGVVGTTFFGSYFSPNQQRAENFWWVGNDGSKIHSIAAYSNQPMPSNHRVTLPSKTLLTQMAKSGFKRPLFGTFRDFFTSYAPLPDLDMLKRGFTYGDANELKVRFITVEEHFKSIPEPVEMIRDFYEAEKSGFPWGILAGESELGDRQNEDMLLQTERFLALTGVDAKGMLDDAWKAHLSGEHHDPRLMPRHAFGIFGAHGTYAQMVKAAFDESKGLCQGLLREAGCLMRDQAGMIRVGGATFVLVNTSGFERREVVPLTAALPKGMVKQPTIYHASSQRRLPVLCEANVLSRHDDGSVKDMEAVLLAQVPGMGCEHCEIAEGDKSALPRVKVLEGESPQIDNGLVRVVAAKEGAQVVAQGQPSFPVLLAGNFPAKGELQTAIRATEVKNDGPAAVLCGGGEIGGVRFKATLKVEPESPMVRLKLQFDFGVNTDVGTVAVGGNDQKLRLVIPLSFASPRFFSHAAFEVRSVAGNGCPILRYVMAEGTGGGIAAFTDRSTMGVFRKDPSQLEIVLAFGGKNTSLNAGKQTFPLGGKHEFEFGLSPYGSDWQKAGIPRLSEVFAQPLLVAGAGVGNAKAQPLVALQPEDAALATAMTRRGNNLFIRLWRPYAGEADIKVSVRSSPKLERTDLLERRPEPQAEVVHMGQHQFLTLRAQVP